MDSNSDWAREARQAHAEMISALAKVNETIGRLDERVGGVAEDVAEMKPRVMRLEEVFAAGRGALRVIVWIGTFLVGCTGLYFAFWQAWNSGPAPR